MLVNSKTYRNVGRNDLHIKQEDGSTRPVVSGETFTAVMHPVTELQLLRGGHIVVEEGDAVEATPELTEPSVLHSAEEEE